MTISTILIVEDEAIVVADLTDKLTRLGYQVAGVAAAGEEAVGLAESLHPHLVLMDIRLEGAMDGIEAAEAIRHRQDVPIIYMTAHSDPATLERAKITGPFGFILKPFDERELTTQIELALYKHRAELEIHRHREWLRVTLTSIGDAVIATDHAGRISFINPVAESLTGWKMDEAMGRPVPEVFQVVNDQTGLPLEKPVGRVLRGGRILPLANHAALITKDGRTVPIEDSAAPILDAAGRVIGAVLVFHDVTEKRRAEKALRKSHDELDLRVRERTAELAEANQVLEHQREVLQTILDNIPVMLCFYDFSGKVQFVSKEFERLMGWSLEEMKRDDLDLLAECCPDPGNRKDARAFMMEESRGWRDFTVRTRSGKGLESSWAYVRLSDGSLIGIGVDITARKEAEEERRVFMKKLEESNQALQEFAFIASHDMMEPLRKVISFGSLLKQKYADSVGEGGRDYLERMINATERMQALVKSLLEYSRLTTKTIPFGPVDLDVVLYGVISDLEVRIEETGAEVRIEKLPTIEGDPTQMRQLFQNLLGNALKFQREGVKLVVEVRGRSLHNGTSEIVVEDNGIGFDPQFLDKIFAPFQRLHGRSAYEGTGMGLAICKKIVERHGGSITASSALGEGSAFMVKLPGRQG